MNCDRCGALIGERARHITVAVTAWRGRHGKNVKGEIFCYKCALSTSYPLREAWK